MSIDRRQVRASWEICVIAGAVLLLGCSGGVRNRGKQEPKHPKPEPTPNFVNATDVDTSAYGPAPDRMLLWKVHSAASRFDIASGKQRSSSLLPHAPAVTAGVGDSRTTVEVRSAEAEQISGEVFRHGKPISTFSADRADGDPATEVLVLSGHVVIVSLEYKATLTCGSIRYDARAKVYRAKGDVRIKMKSGAVGTLSEALATPDLSKVATPDLFQAQL